jgi:hypothetical protein
MKPWGEEGKEDREGNVEGTEKTPLSGRPEETGLGKAKVSTRPAAPSPSLGERFCGRMTVGRK